MALELTVLGRAGPPPGPGRACSGYLVTNGDTRLLLDAGNGSTANLQRFAHYRDLDAIVVSHRHVDHCVDLIGAFYALKFDPSVQRRIPLYAAAEVHDTLTGLMSSDSAMAFDDVFDHTEVGEGRSRRGSPSMTPTLTAATCPRIGLRWMRPVCRAVAMASARAT
jgi:ribonuclease BN (tRNA processing enzyme)